MRWIELSGSPEQMGTAFGEACRAEIAELYARRLENALAQARRFGGREAREADLLALAEKCLSSLADWDPAGHAELCGIARGAGLDPARVLAMQGLTDLRDALAWGGTLEAAGGCTSFVVQGDATSDGRVWCGQTWDLATDNRPAVVSVHRRPADGPETWCVTTAGCLSLMGINADGLAVGTTNLRTHDARAGVPYLSLIHRALACTRCDPAVALLTGAPRAGAHYYYVADARGRAAAVECTATRSHVTWIGSGSYAQTNHCRIEAHARLEGNTPQQSSRARLRRMQALLAAGAGRHDRSSLQAALADRKGGPLAIRRDDFDGISTHAAIVMAPEAGRAWACHGLPGPDGWVSLLG
ncbi:MAG: C45 family autoproteolytic acyltransferase/hydrolase [Myxococcota bacterium]|nr:C45 family autoproteolytic acyltransferase/hydrolase [Myxococcota bacterium]